MTITATVEMARNPAMPERERALLHLAHPSSTVTLTFSEPVDVNGFTVTPPENCWLGGWTRPSDTVWSATLTAGNGVQRQSSSLSVSTANDAGAPGTRPLAVRHFDIDTLRPALAHMDIWTPTHTPATASP